MNINEMYICRSSLFPAPERDLSRLVIIREFNKDAVTFSVYSDNQPNIEANVVRFYTSAFTVDRSHFEEFFEPFSQGIPAKIGGKQ